MAKVAIYKFVFADGVAFGVGTQVEFEHWLAEGVIEPDARLGAVIGYEPAAMDDERKLLWAKEMENAV